MMDGWRGWINRWMERMDKQMDGEDGYWMDREKWMDEEDG